MRSPYILIEDTISNDTVEALQQLLSHARKGDVIGIVYAAMLKRRGFIVNSAGEAFRNPTFSRGMIAALDDKMSGRIRGGNP